MTGRSGPAAPSRLSLSAAGCIALLLWLEAGYAVGLKLIVGSAWGTALWQGAVCLAAVGVLLLAVLHLLSVPKLLRRLPRSVVVLSWRLAASVEFLVPWAGWSGLIWLLNRGATRAEALYAGAAIAVFSYLTGIALVVRFRPRATDVELTELDIPIVGLPQGFDGYRILHISDLHANAFLPVAGVRERLARAAPLKFDLVACTGDLSGETVSMAEGVTQALAELRARDGVFAVLGNHDIWVGEEGVTAALARAGITALMNASASISRNGDTLYLAGVNDSSYTGKADLGAALARVPKEGVVVLLSHAPEIVRDQRAGRAALILSGHTHGGQVALPVIGPLYVPSRLGRKYAAGLHRIGGSWLFINRGLGEITPPIRINCPPEIALLTLRSVESN